MKNYWDSNFLDALFYFGTPTDVEIFDVMSSVSYLYLLSAGVGFDQGICASNLESDEVLTKFDVFENFLVELPASELLKLYTTMTSR